MFGAERTLSSRMIANGLPTFSWVTRAKRRAPAVLNLMSTTGRPSWSKLWRGVGQLVARDHHAALDRDRRRCRRPSAGPGCPAARGPAATCGRVGVRSTSLNSSRAVWPISALSASGSSTPGTWTRMRLSPSVMTVISLVPPRIDAAADDVARDAHRVVERLRRCRSAVGVRTMRVESTTLHVPVALAGQCRPAGSACASARPRRRPGSGRGP